MKDKMNLLDISVPLQERYDKFLIWLSSKNHAVIEFMAQELGLTVSEVDVFNELGELDDHEFKIIDQIGFDIGHLFIVVRAPKEVRKIMYNSSVQVLKSQQPLTSLMEIADKHNDYTSIEYLVRQISGNCLKSLASYLSQRDITSGTITKSIRSMLVQVGNKINGDSTVTDKQYEWIIRAIQHDHGKSLGIFTNQTIQNDYDEDYQIILNIHEYIERYEKD